MHILPTMNRRMRNQSRYSPVLFSLLELSRLKLKLILQIDFNNVKLPQEECNELQGLKFMVVHLPDMTNFYSYDQITEHTVVVAHWMTVI